MFQNPPMNDLIAILNSGGSLSADDIARAAEALLADSVDDAEKAAFLVALAEKGESPEEIAAFVEAFLGRAVTPDLGGAGGGGGGEPLLDVCGTGGDKLDLFNVSTSAVFVLAGAGVRVVKHGNRGITSKSGGADVLEALGIRIDPPPDRIGDCLEAVGAAFLFAPRYHPAFKAVVKVRQALAAEGRRTIFNLLGPLLNPARPTHQLIGVFSGDLAPVFAKILARLGRKRAWAVHGTTETGAGMDEISTLGSSTVWKVADGAVLGGETVTPADLGLAPATLGDLRGGDAAENAKILTAILDGTERGPKRDIVLLNAAAGLTICGRAADLGDGLRLAAEAIDSGAAMEKLGAWREFH